MSSQSDTPSFDSFIERLETTLPKFQNVAKTILTTIQGEDRLTLQQLRSLQAIEKSDGGMLTTKLAKRLNIASPTMTRIIDGLVDRELVDRVPDLDDRRRMRLVTRPSGSELLAIYETALHAHLADRLATLDDAQRTRLWEALDDLDAILSDAPASSTTKG